MRAGKRVSNPSSGVVSLLLTFDVHARPRLADDLAVCLDYLRMAGLRATFFVPAVLVAEHRLTSVLERLVGEGHQLAGHGLLHRPPEDFVTDSFETQRRNLAGAKAILEDAVQTEVTAFRAPTFRLSARTLEALEETGYTVDLSVNPQRLGLLSSQPANVGWLVAPRVPYHPRQTNPYRPGSMKLWEVPTTSFVVPFTSLLYQALGLRVARGYSRVMLAEARMTGAPVVFLLHPEELAPSSHIRPPYPKTLRSLIPRANGGIDVRYWIYERDESKIHQDTLSFLDHLRTQQGVRYLSVDEYLRELFPSPAAPDVSAAQG